MTRIELFELLHSGLLKLNQPIPRPLENTLIYYIELVERHKTKHTLQPQAQLLVMKGVYPSIEIGER